MLRPLSANRSASHPRVLSTKPAAFGRYTEADFRRLASDPPVDPAATMTRVRRVLDDAEAFVVGMPTDKAGLLFLQADNVLQPDPDRLDTYQTHAGQRRGQWPNSPEITAAMFERYNNKPSPGLSGNQN